MQTEPEYEFVTEEDPELAPKCVHIKTGRRETRHMMQVRKYNKPLTHPIAGKCGHKIDMEVQPRHRNCPDCWFYFFAGHKDLVETTDELFQKYGGYAIAGYQGKKFVRKFLQFMSTLAQWQKTMEEAEKEKENGAEIGTV